MTVVSFRDYSGRRFKRFCSFKRKFELHQKIAPLDVRHFHLQPTATDMGLTICPRLIVSSGSVRATSPRYLAVESRASLLPTFGTSIKGGRFDQIDRRPAANSSRRQHPVYIAGWIGPGYFKTHILASFAGQKPIDGREMSYGVRPHLRFNVETSIGVHFCMVVIEVFRPLLRSASRGPLPHDRCRNTNLIRIVHQVTG